MSDTPPLHAEALLEHTRWVRGLAHALVRDGQNVDDLVQDTWVAALEHPPQEARSLRAWLSGVLRNVARLEQRSQSRRRARQERAPQRDPGSSVDELVERADLHQRVVRAVLDLEEPLRSTVLMRYFDDLSAEEIARRLALPSSTVRSRLQKALASLRVRFDREADGERQAWVPGMVALALPRGGAVSPTFQPPSVDAAAAASSGVLAMTIKSVCAAACVMAVGFGASNAFRQANDDPSGAGAALAALAPPTSLTGETLEPPRLSRQEKEKRRALEGEKESVAPFLVSGRVVEASGAPIPGATLFVGGQPSPFPLRKTDSGMRIFIADGRDWKPATGEEDDYAEDEMGEGIGEWKQVDEEGLRSRGTLLGRTFRTDDEGRYHIELPEKVRVYLTVLDRPGSHPVSHGGWHNAPAEVDLLGRTVPTAELELWITDLTTQERLKAFGGTLWRGEQPIARWGADSEVVQRTIEVPAGAAPTYKVVIHEPIWAKTTHEFHPVVGGRNPVEILVQSGEGFRGQVVDALGQPVEGALVYWGDVLDLRSHSLFRPYDTKRVTGAVRTDFEGRFKLPGLAERVSVWHAQHSPASATIMEAALLSLPARATIRGRMLDETGQPAPDRQIELDRVKKTRTDDTGAFVIEGVEAGVHGLRMGERHFIGLQIAPGETIYVEPIELVERARWPVHSGGVPYHAERTGGVIIGTGRIFSLSEWGLEEGYLGSGRLRPERTLAMSNRGLMFFFDAAQDGETVIELGTAKVTLEVPRDMPAVYLLPEEVDQNPVARYWGARFFGEREGGRVRYGPIAAGSYSVIVHGSGVVGHVTVNEGEQLELLPEDWLAPEEGR